jgi:hypothetical protein
VSKKKQRKENDNANHKCDQIYDHSD